jgi:hypothetical protein
MLDAIVGLLQTKPLAPRLQRLAVRLLRRLLPAQPVAVIPKLMEFFSNELGQLLLSMVRLLFHFFFLSSVSKFASWPPG